MPINTELIITIKDEESKLTEKDNIYGPLEISFDNQSINDKILNLLTRFRSNHKHDDVDIIVKTITIWKNDIN